MQYRGVLFCVLAKESKDICDFKECLKWKQIGKYMVSISIVLGIVTFLSRME